MEEVKETILHGRSVRSLDATFREEEEQSLLDILPDDRQESPEIGGMKGCLRQQIESALGSLMGREAEILRLYFGLEGEKPMTLDQIGVRFCLTRERVRQIKEKALHRLRHPSRCDHLRTYSRACPGAPQFPGSPPRPVAVESTARGPPFLHRGPVVVTAVSSPHSHHFSFRPRRPREEVLHRVF